MHLRILVQLLLIIVILTVPVINESLLILFPTADRQMHGISSDMFYKRSSLPHGHHWRMDSGGGFAGGRKVHEPDRLYNLLQRPFPQQPFQYRAANLRCPTNCNSHSYTHCICMTRSTLQYVCVKTLMYCSYALVIHIGSRNIGHLANRSQGEVTCSHHATSTKVQQGDTSCMT